MNKEELLKKYNEIFKAKEEIDIDIKRRIGVLEIIFKALEDSLYSPTDEYKSLIGKYVEKSDKLIDILTEEQV